MDTEPPANKPPETGGSFKRPFVVLCVVTVFVVIYCGKLIFDRSVLSIRTSFALEQIGIFDDMRLQAYGAEPSKAVKSLEYAAKYYPSGTKQIAGSRLDRIVEHARANAVARIIEDLRSRTGEDLGDDPQHWIDRFSRD